MFLKNKVLILILILPIYAFAFVTVGSDPEECTYTSLFEAYQDDDVTVRVTSEFFHFQAFTIEKSKVFVGGFDDCSQANLGIVGSTKSKWSGVNSGEVITIIANQVAQSIVTFSNFEIYDGEDTAFAGVGGILVVGKVSVILTDSDIHDNTGYGGGGISIFGEDALVILNNTKVRNNSATDTGGGVFCVNGASLTILGDSAISGNTATNKGGGIYADNGCSINDQSGDVNSGFGAQIGIFANIAKFGGGVYLEGASTMLLTGNNDHPASIDFNFSNNANEQITAGGGGVYLTGNGTSLTANNAKIINNLANTGGAGIVVLDSAQFTMSRYDSPCWDNEKCSVLSQNVVLFEGGIGGAGYIAGDAVVDISQTKIDGNQARSRAVFDIRQATVGMEGNLITNNRARLAPLTSNSLFSLRENATLNFHYNTVASNNSNGIFELRLRTEQELKVNNSIIWDQGEIITVVDNSGANFPIAQDAAFECAFVHERASLSVDTSETDVFIIDPSFIDSANNNYQLSSDSFAIDSCDETSIQSQHSDINGNQRGVDIIGFPNFRGPYDIGAYEKQIDVIFSNGFD